MKMKILVPLRSFDQIDTYINAGADEFYFGFDDPVWEKTFGSVNDMNRMSAMKARSNSFSRYDVPEVIRRIHARGRKCYITLNANCYSRNHLAYCEEFFSGLTADKPDGIIFSDILLADAIRRADMVPVASTMCAIYNTDILEYYRQMGVVRVILPRELSLDEIRAFTNLYPQMEFETFLMRNGCMFSDSNCLGVHRGNFGGLCGFIRNSDHRLISDEPPRSIHGKRFRHALYTDMMLRNACGLCAIYRMLQMNISAVKIVGRADRTDEVAKDIRTVRRNMEIACECTSEEMFLAKIEIPDRWKTVCGLSCYYPEVSVNKLW